MNHELEEIQYQAAIAYLERRRETIIMDWKSIKFLMRWMNIVPIKPFQSSRF